MKRLAVFTEGQTEQLFLQKLLQEICGVKHISFELRKVPSSPTLAKITSASLQNPDLRYMVLLYDCQNDERVKSEILEHRESLTKAGYDSIIGLRDLYPLPAADIARIKQKLRTRVPTLGVPTHILLAVPEIEAWFLQEEFHYAKIDPALDPTTFGATFGFDPLNTSAENVTHPAEMLHRIYASVGKAYKKTRNHVQRTVEVLDYESLYLDKAAFLPHFDELLSHLDAFFAV